MGGRKESSVTTKDIAKKLGVSAVSVHRALSGKEGVSDELRAKILKTSKEMGYQFNYAASSIRKKKTYFAIILPTDDKVYYEYFWEGVNDCFSAMKSLNIAIDSFVCRDEKEQCEQLKSISDQKGTYAGVLTFSYTRNASFLLQLQRLIAQGLATVVIDDSIKEPEGICCIPPNEKTIGTVAGELVALTTPEKGKVIVTEGRKDSVLHVNKLKSFLSYLKENKPNLKPVIVPGYYKPEQYKITQKSILDALVENPDTVACYALNSHDNLPFVNAVEMSGMKDKVRIIGTDFYDLTKELLSTGRITAVINQGAYTKGYIGMKILVNTAVKNLELPGNITTPIDVIFKSNVSCYDSFEVRQNK